MEGRLSALIAWSGSRRVLRFVLRQTRTGLGGLGLGGYVQSDQSKAGKIYALPLRDSDASQMECMPTGVNTVTWRLLCAVRS
jgi:hypothetical protein